MARLIKGIFGAISGKLGPIVGGVWKGIPYIRLKPKKKKKKVPRTAAQIANEQKFKYGNNWFVPFHPFIEVGFQNLAIEKTAITAGFSANYLPVISGVYPDLKVDYTKVVISKGKLRPLGAPQVSLSGANAIDVRWLTNMGAQAAYNDQVMLVLYSPELEKADGFIGFAKRADKQCTFKFNEELAGTLLEVYISVVSLDRKRIADSVYLGKVLPL